MRMTDSKRSEAGRKAAAARWGEPRLVRLDGLTDTQRRVVIALVEAMRESNAAHSA